MTRTLLERFARPFALTLGAIAIPLYAYKFTQKTDYTDFDVYYRAGLRFLNGQWDLLYSLTDGASPFRYAPPLLLLFAPLACLPIFTAKLVWFILQTGGYAIGFRALDRALESSGFDRSTRRWVVATSFLMVLRLILDSWTIGQISGLMFAGFGLSLQGYVQSRLGMASAGLFLPALLKIGPGFGYIPILFEAFRLRRTRRVIAVPLFLFVCAQLVLWLTLPASLLSRLWSDWAVIVASDSTYYDASHYGSQSLKSFLLRTFMMEEASQLWLVWGLALISALGLLLFRQSTREPKQRLLLFALSYFPVLLLMPETFKYSMTPLAFPVGVALASGYAKYPLWAIALTISLPGLDIVGKTVFFAIQRMSLPFFSMSALCIALLRRATQAPLRNTFAPIPLPELSPEAARPEHACLFIRADARPDAFSIDDRAWVRRLSDSIRAAHVSLDVVYCDSQSALIHAMGKTDAQWLFICQLSQPCDPEFYVSARERLLAGAHWVRAARRDRQTRFVVPVLHLPLAYRRHRMGVALNGLLRLIFGRKVKFLDVLSLNGVMTRELARQCVSHSTTGGLLSLLEWQLTAVARDLPIEEQPCRYWLRTEKPGPRVLLEVASIALDLPRILRAWIARHYEPLPEESFRAITADDWGLSPGVNAGILDLASAGIVKRVSMMVNEPFVEKGLPELLKIPNIEAGLHFNLSHGEPITLPRPLSPLQWLKVGHREQVQAQVVQELQAQLSRARQLGIPVRYLDGHHHIHLIPGWIAALAPLLKEFGVKTVRIPWDYRLLGTRKFPLAILAWLARRQSRRLGFESLPCRYPTPEEVTKTRDLRRVLLHSAGSEIITHPASIADLSQSPHPDPYNEGRVLEWRALRSLRP